MNKTTTITLDLLNTNSVSVIRETEVEMDGQLYSLGRYRTAYSNSPSGRSRIESELPDIYAAAVFAVWGDTPTIDDPPTSVSTTVA